MARTVERFGVLPVPTPETAPFWDGARAGRFLLRWCLDCGRTHWFPRAICPFCLSDNGEWRPISGRGIVHSYTVAPRPQLHVVAMVTLAEGPTVTTNLVDCDTDEIAIGQAVEVVFRPTEDGGALPLFRPLAAGPS